MKLTARFLPLTGLFLASLASGSMAQASTVNTYSFSQNYLPLGQVPGGTLTGTFTGTVEPSGYINLNDLQSMTLMYQFGIVTIFESAPPSFFSFATNGGASTLDFVVTAGLNNMVCVGAVAALYSPCASSAPLGAVGLVLPGVGYATSFPTVTLTKSVTVDAAPPAPPASAPEPATIIQLGLAAGAAAWRMKRRTNKR